MKKFLIDHDNFQDFVNVNGQTFPSSQFGYDERFDKLKKRQNDFKKKMYYQQELHYEIPMNEPKTIITRRGPSLSVSSPITMANEPCTI